MESNIVNIIQDKLTQLEDKSKLYKLKRYEKNLMKKYRNLLSVKDKKELTIEQMMEYGSSVLEYFYFRTPVL